MLEQYYAIKEQYQDAILFFRLGDFYEMFGEDARVASRILDIALTGRDAGKDYRIPMCGIPYHAMEGYLATLIRHGYKVAICDQVEDPKEAKGVVKREVVRVVTPGTVMEPDLLEEKAHNFLVTLCCTRDVYGLAVIDISTGYFGLTEIRKEKNDQQLWDELQRLAPAECLVGPELAADTGWQARAAQRLSVPVTAYNERAFALETARETLLRHFGTSSLAGFGCEEMTAGIRAGGAALSYLQETQKRVLPHINQITVYSVENYMILESATRRNLELTRTLRDGEFKGSLLWVLDETVTAMGGRMLRQWIQQPLLQAEAINRRLRAVEDLANNTLLREELREALAGIYDLERLLGRVVYGSANARDLVALRSSFQKLPAVRDLIQQEAQSDTLRTLAGQIDVLPEITRLLEQSLVESPPVSVKEGGLIAPGYSPRLDELRTAAREGKEWIAQLEARERERTGIKSLKVGFNKVFGYYIEVTRANLAAVPDTYQRKQTLANAERYVTPELKEKENLILGAEEKAVQLEYELFCDIRDRVSEAAPRLQKTAAIVAEIDVLAGLAEVAVRRRYCRPVIEEGTVISIKAGRHPVVEAMLGEGQFVPNDVYLDCQTAQLLILTGPNMAGKSTYLRMVALITLMAQIGSFVPADRARIGLVDRIFTRVGASDDLATGQSTFMVEMNEIMVALSQGTERSLLIIDELGRGTSTYDGLALAQAIAEYIHDHIGARTIFSTHYHELSRLALDRPRIRNLRMEVQEKGSEVIFLYKVGEGAADKSYGVHVARLAGLPAQVLRRARAILKDLETERSFHQANLDIFFQAAAATTEERAEETQEESLTPPEAISVGLEGERGCSYQACETCPRAEWTEAASKILQEMRQIDISRCTPLEALNQLARWQRQLEEGQAKS